MTGCHGLGARPARPHCWRRSWAAVSQHSGGTTPVIGRENRIPPRMDPPKQQQQTNKQTNTKRKSSEIASLTVVVDTERRLGGVVLEGKMSWWKSPWCWSKASSFSVLAYLDLLSISMRAVSIISPFPCGPPPPPTPTSWASAESTAKLTDALMVDIKSEEHRMCHGHYSTTHFKRKGSRGWGGGWGGSLSSKSHKT